MKLPVSSWAMVNATREIRALHRSFCDELVEAVHAAGLADRFARLPPGTALPDYRAALAFGWSQANERGLRDRFGEVSARLAVLGMLSVTDAHLRSLLLLRRLAEGAASGVDDAALREKALERMQKEDDRKTARELLDALIAKPSPDLVEARHWLDGLAVLRRSLARPGAVVSEDDVATGEGKLRVVWRKTVGALDGDLVETLREGFVGEQLLSLRYVEQTRAFPVGKPIVLDASDADAIAISLACVGAAAARGLHDEIARIVG